MLNVAHARSLPRKVCVVNFATYIKPHEYRHQWCKDDGDGDGGGNDHDRGVDFDDGRPKHEKRRERCS